MCIRDSGYTGLKDDYLYFNGKRLDADDDYRLYYYDGDIYLTNTKGKVQKSSKKYDICLLYTSWQRRLKRLRTNWKTAMILTAQSMI